MVTLIYSSNNSGGHWWLSDEDWQRLSDAGWNVFWGDTVSGYSDDPAELLAPVGKTGARWLGALARGCAKQVESVMHGIAEWEEITGQDACAIGCNCCGVPHDFRYITDDGKSHYVSVELPTEGTLSFE